MTRGSDRLASLTSDLLATDLPLLTQREADEVAHATALHLSSLPDATWAGVRAAQTVVTIATSALGRRPYSQMTREDRTKAVRRLATSRLPLVAEYFRLVRGVALVVHHEDAQ